MRTHEPEYEPKAGLPAILPRRLWTLYLRTRHVPGALGVLAALGTFLWADLFWNWTIAGGPAAQQLALLIVIAGAASVVGVATHGPFGEPEQATGRWLPYLRVGTAILGGILSGGRALGRTRRGLSGMGTVLNQDRMEDAAESRAERLRAEVADLDRPVREIMTANPKTVSSGALMHEAVALMAERKISELPVVDANGRPVGMLDITDLIGLEPALPAVESRPLLRLTDRKSA